MSAHLVEILLPLTDNQSNPFSESLLRGIQRELSEKFGGLTAFELAPAKGVWTSGGGETRDDIVVIEVMVEDIDGNWWKDFRARTEKLLGQQKLIVRAHTVEMF